MPSCAGAGANGVRTQRHYGHVARVGTAVSVAVRASTGRRIPLRSGAPRLRLQPSLRGDRESSGECAAWICDSPESRPLHGARAGERPSRGTRPVQRPLPSLAQPGENTCVSVRTTPLRDAHGAIVGGMAILDDLTDHAHTTSALQVSEQRLTLHVKRSPLGVICLDIQGTIVEWNASATRIFGWRQAEALESSAWTCSFHRRSSPSHAKYSARSSPERADNPQHQREERPREMGGSSSATGTTPSWWMTRAMSSESPAWSTTSPSAIRRNMRSSGASALRSLIENSPDAIGAFLPDDQRFIYANHLPRLASWLRCAGRAPGRDHPRLHPPGRSGHSRSPPALPDPGPRRAAPTRMSDSAKGPQYRPRRNRVDDPRLRRYSPRSFSSRAT